MAAMTNAQKQAALRAKRKTEGQVNVKAWIPPELAERLRAKFPGARGGIDYRAALEAAVKEPGDDAR
uniref:Uncharacterized protein n=1 Tax=Candidatus Kentrum sp. UNK TaxID=2126344 RepID=A0A451AGM2_9GAMM|nr:MAG: hypothetical protein BECKUNK1418G_GA0071005_10584 [Candidatus Kentron sp. UNK]VFK71314.1 MAG: hypothetical protein BECKUNK1418H_GA0071006_10604 [Candidatus Kentron sp. UNK]